MRKQEKEKDTMLNLDAFQEYMNKAENFNLHNRLEVTEIRDQYCEARVELSKWSKNPQGVAHGSLIFALCDVVTGVAAATGGRSMLTLNSSISFLRPGVGSRLRAVGSCVREGRTTGLYQAHVYDDQDRLVSTGNFTVFYTGQQVVLKDFDSDPVDEEVPPGGSLVWS